MSVTTDVESEFIFNAVSYTHLGITVIGENSFVPEGVTIGKNCVIHGKTSSADYKDSILESGKSIIMEEEDL